MAKQEFFIEVVGVDKASDKFDAIQGKLNKLGNVALGLGTAGLAGLAAGLTTSVMAAAEAEDAVAQLEQILTATGGVAGLTKDEILELATSFQSMTKFSDEAIIQTAGWLLTFKNIGEETFPRALEAALDLSQALGQDLKSSAMQLGKALNDPVEGVTALRRVGISFTESQLELIESLVESGQIASAQSVILKELETQIGGTARAAGETLTGQLTILKNTFGDVQEEIGFVLIPSLTELGKVLLEELRKPETIESIKILAQTSVEMAKIFLEHVIPVMKDMIRWFNELSPATKSSISAIISLAPVVLIVIGVFAKLIAMIMSVVSLFGSGGALAGVTAFVGKTVLPALGAAIGALSLPVVLLIAAIGGLILVIHKFGNQAWESVRMLAGIVYYGTQLVLMRFTELWNRMRAMDWLAIGRGIILRIVDGIKQTIHNAVSAMNDLRERIISAIQSINWYKFGRDIIQGIINGMMAMGGILREMARRLVQSIIDAMKAAAGIFSPSKLAQEEVGRPIAEGIALGARETLNRAQPKLNLDTFVEFLKPAVLSFAVPTMGSATKAMPSITINYSPMLSTVDHEELLYRLQPIFKQLMRDL